MRSPILHYFKTFAVLPLMLGLSLIQLSSCKKNITIRERVYFEDAEDGIANNIQAITGTGANYGNMVRPFAGTNVIGNFNNTLVTIQLDQMPSHNMVYVAFDLYTHDRWEGNRVGLPDIVDVFNCKTAPAFVVSHPPISIPEPDA